MNPFKFLNVVVLAILFSEHEVSAPTARETLCLSQINDFFPGSNVMELARLAMTNYTTRTNFFGCARVYYMLIGGSLNENSIKSPREFCNERRQANLLNYLRPCERIIRSLFPRDKIDIVTFAYYQTSIRDLNVHIGTIRENIRTYFMSIVESFTLNDPDFPSPNAYCHTMFSSIDPNIDRLEIGNERNEVNRNVEDNRNDEVNRNNEVNTNNENDEGRDICNYESEEETGLFCYHTGL